MKRAEPFDVTTLEGLGASPLRQAWRNLLGGEPPPLRAPELLRRELAARIQAQLNGDIDASLKRRLDRLAHQSRQHGKLNPVTSRPPVGATLIKEWSGVRHSVVVLRDGFLYQGESYRSLSQIARLITGARWSGPRFFGLDGGRAQ